LSESCRESCGGAAYAREGTYLPSLVEGNAAVYSPDHNGYDGPAPAAIPQLRLDHARRSEWQFELQLTATHFATTIPARFTLLANYSFPNRSTLLPKTNRRRKTATDPYDLNFR